MFASILLALIAGVGFAPGAAPSDIAALRQPGVTVPPITLPNIAGGTLPLRDPNGRVTVLVIFAAWCDPCRKNLPAIERLAQSRRARFVGIDELESPAKARALVAEYGLTFPVGILTDAGVRRAGCYRQSTGGDGSRYSGRLRDRFAQQIVQGICRRARSGHIGNRCRYYRDRAPLDTSVQSISRRTIACGATEILCNEKSGASSISPESTVRSHVAGLRIESK